MKKRSPLQKQHEFSTPKRARVPVGTTVLVALVAALLLVTPLTPTESHYESGSAAPLVVMWMLAAVIASAGALGANETVGPAASDASAQHNRGAVANIFYAMRGGWRKSPAVGATVALVAWVALSGLLIGGHGNYRWVVNAVWQWVACGVSVLILFRLARRSASQRGLVLLGMVSAVTAASYGIYEWRWVHPEVVRQYEADPEGTLQRAGIVAEEGSPQRRQFEDRLRSTEPFATFGLPNSLAGFLVTWLVVAVGLARRAWQQERRDISWLVGLSATIVVILGCLALTKSRTAWLAGIIATAGLLVTGGQIRGWSWTRRLAMVAVALALAGTAAVSFVDPLVVAQAPLSVRYRLEYWAGSLRLLADYPVFGCGVGNFQSFYPTYMFPWSSETVADPHNFLIELFATAGIPAGVLAVLLVVQLLRSVAPPEAPTVAAPVEQGLSTKGPRTLEHWSIIAGAILGWLGLPCLMLTQGQLPDPVLLLILGALLPLGLVAGDRWLRDPRPVSCGLIWWGLVAWLINALAAGAIGIWGVVQSFWLLAAIIAAGRNRNDSPNKQSSAAGSSRFLPVLSVAGALGLLVAAWSTEARPTVGVRRLAAEAAAAYDERDAERTWLAAAEADPLSSLPWERLAVIRLGHYLERPADQTWNTFHHSVKGALRRNRHSAPLYRQAGDWYLVAWRSTRESPRRGEKEMLNAYRDAVRCHPANAFYHAQLAWAYWLAGRREPAIREATIALELDDQVPHEELRLANRRLFEGVQATSFSAERRMEQIRNNSVDTIESTRREP